MRIDVMNGPNLNLLGTREPAVYGGQTLATLEARLSERAAALGATLVFTQSNHEGALIDAVHAAAAVGSAGVVINPGGLTHSSVSLRDALVGTALPFVEVHISNVYAREPFRHVSLLRDVAIGCIVGLGVDGYLYALDALAQRSARGAAPR
ncbi:MAG: type II 3-dehydroquinate dehydratase [Myxococcales bacterium]|nr:type II 3-dehydroquinate dehydratase [Myxococcales bacterium]MCB9531616.1 type II 3-dehydroquinate dehydratase [Myxococcales bacterium]MCB9532733.1 type II 3-dehydroquinate dehydratase [Myxococcales bacterium]